MCENGRHHRLPGSFFIRLALLARPHKTKNPIPTLLLGQDTSCGATRLDAPCSKTRPLFAYRHTRIVVNGEVRSVSHTPAGKRPFLLALGSPFGLTLSAALTPIRGSLRESWGGLLTLPHRFGKRIPPESKPCQERGRKKFQRIKAAHVRTLRGGPARRPLFLDIAPFRVVQLKPATGRCGGMVDTRDLKSLAGDRVPVRVRSPAPERAPLSGRSFWCRTFGAALIRFAQIDGRGRSAPSQALPKGWREGGNGRELSGAAPAARIYPLRSINWERALRPLPSPPQRRGERRGGEKTVFPPRSAVAFFAPPC